MRPFFNTGHVSKCEGQITKGFSDSLNTDGMNHFNLSCSFKSRFKGLLMPPIKSKYHTSCLYILACCPRFFKELVTPPLTHTPPYPQLPAHWVLYSSSFLRSASLNKILCITVNFKENTLLHHEKKDINQLDSYLFGKKWKIY